MKAEILKIAGVKSEKEFYKKYPSEEAFMKAHGKEFKKAKLGKAIAPKAQRGEEINPELWASQMVGIEQTPSVNIYQTGPYSLEHFTQYLPEYKQTFGIPTDKGGDTFDEMFLNLQNRGVDRQDAANIMSFLNDYYTPEGKLKTVIPEHPVTKKKGKSMDSPEAEKERIKKHEKIQGTFGVDYYKEGGQLKKLQQLTDFGNPPQAAIGAFIGGEQDQFQPLTFDQFQEDATSRMTGVSTAERNRQQQLAAMNSKGQSGGDASGGGGDMIGGLLGMAKDVIPMLGKGKKGKKVPKNQNAKVKLDIWGNPMPTPAPVQMQLNPNAGVGQLGLNGGQTLNLTGGTGATDISNQTNLWGTGETVSTAGALGGKTPGSIAGIASQTAGKNTMLDKLGGAAGLAGGAINLAGSIYSGIQGLNAEKEAKKQAQTAFDVSNLVAQASNTEPEKKRKVYDTPWASHNIIQPGQFNRPQGVGTNVLTAKDGAMIGGNPTEIQNMYNPGDIYSDLGFEPLSDSDIIKQYRAGGFIPRAQFGAIAGALGGPVNNLVGGAFGNSAGSGLGSTIGSTLGMVGGPVGSLIGGALGGVVGGFLDKTPQETAKLQASAVKNAQNAAFKSGVKGMQSQLSGFVRNGGDIPQHEEGGWVSHNWQPQVITKFGDVDVSQLHSIATEGMDTLRTGGHITQNNKFPQDQFALGGELKTTWGGYAETISHNPYEASETGIFRGKSHEESDGNGHTGIGVKYGEGGHDSYTDYAEYGTKDADADVEVERGEPYKKDEEGNMRVAGNLITSKEAALAAGDLKFFGKKYKTNIKDLAIQDASYTKNIDSASSELADFSDDSAIGLLKKNALGLKIEGNKMKLKNNKKASDALFAHQDAVNEVSEMLGADADAFAKGKFKIDPETQKQQAKYGKMIKKYQNSGAPVAPTGNFVGPTPDDYLEKLYEQAKTEGSGKATKMFQEEFHRFYPDVAKDIILKDTKVTSKGKKMGIKSVDDLKTRDTSTILNTNVDSIFGDRTKQYHTMLQNLKKPDFVLKPTTPTFTDTSKKPDKDKKVQQTEVLPNKRKWWMDAINMALPYFRGTDQEEFDSAQIYPEEMDAVLNQYEPVDVRLYHPDLGTPQDISLQDQLNANQADFNATLRAAGYNPAAAAALSAMKYAANEKVLGEQFRLNQAERQRVYEGNRALLNDAKLKNIGLLDQQMVRNLTGQAKTRQQAVEIAKSITDKIAKQKLENRTLGIYENLYNYRFDPSGRAINWNGLVQFDTSVGGATARNSAQGIPAGYEYIYNSQGQPIDIRKIPKESLSGSSSATMPDLAMSKNGKSIKKNARNGNIVKAIKNL